MERPPMYLVASMLLFGLAIPACSDRIPVPLDTGSGWEAKPISLAIASPLKVFTAGRSPGFPAGAEALDVAQGPSGSLWFTDRGTPAIGHITSVGKIDELRLPYGSQPMAIVAGTRADAWFTDVGTNSVGHVLSSQRIEEFSIPGYSGSEPTGIVRSADGISFVVIGPQSGLGNVREDGTVKMFRIRKSFEPDGSLGVANNGDLWLLGTDASQHAVLMQQPPRGDPIFHRLPLVKVDLPCCPNLAATRMALDSQGNLWFTLRGYGFRNELAIVGSVGASGIRLVKVPAPHGHPQSFPTGIALLGRDVWFGGNGSFRAQGALWRTTPDENITGLSVPYAVDGLSADSEGHLWFTVHFGSDRSKIVEAAVKSSPGDREMR